MIDQNRLKLRDLSVRDFALLVKIETDRANLIYSGFKTPPELDELVTFIQDENNILVRKQKRFTIEFEDRAIGFIDLFDVDFEVLSAEVGIIILAEFRRMQIGFNALGLLINEAIAIGLKKLDARCRSDNFPSISLFQKADFLISSQTSEFVHLQLQLDA
jgi:RimJ/RimL family protein N-acetyltransferase